MIYDEVLLEHNLHPEHEGKISGKNVITKKLVNASCGDRLTIYLKISNADGEEKIDAKTLREHPENFVISDGGFEGAGCAISKASADLMLGNLIGQSVETALQNTDLLFDALRSGEPTEKFKQAFGEAAALSEVSRMPARVKCAKLAWQVFSDLNK